MYKIAICDDDSQVITQLKALLEQYAKQRGIQFEIDAFQEGVSFLQGFTKDKYHFILLDVYLGRRTGIEIAKAIRKRDQDVMIVFVTSSLHHAIESYEVKAFHYLLKPIDQDKLFQVLGECLKNVEKEVEGLIVTAAGRTENIPHNTIEFLESSGHKVIVHTTYGDFTVYEKLDAMQERLNNETFIRVKQSYLVNMQYIQSIEGNKITLKSGAITTIRHSNIKQIKKTYIKYLLD
ncbi:MAG: LytR/AlgR family response regulator transcription factor [Erysipelotrichaceae bacterium]